MVSSKCLSVVSPSPLRFLAALMPPWAQTEWERLTGTIEKRSTLPPASAILMTAASPAKPPPTTMILDAAIRFRVLSTCLQKLQEKTYLNVRWFMRWLNGVTRNWGCVLEGRCDAIPCVDHCDCRAEPCQLIGCEVCGDGGIVFVGDVMFGEPRQ